MARQEGKASPNDPDDFAFPEGVLPTRDHEDEDQPHLIRLCSVSASDLNDIYTTLHSAGIYHETHAADEADLEADPTLPVDVLVRDADLDAARQVLAQPASSKQSRDDEFEDEFYVSRDTCPRCKNELTSVPISTARRRLNHCFYVLLFVPLSYLVIADLFTIGLPSLVAHTGLLWIWIAAVLLLWGGLFLPAHPRQCLQCGFNTYPLRRR